MAINEDFYRIGNDTLFLNIRSMAETGDMTVSCNGLSSITAKNSNRMFVNGISCEHLHVEAEHTFIGLDHIQAVNIRVQAVRSDIHIWSSQADSLSVKLADESKFYFSKILNRRIEVDKDASSQCAMYN
jgi:hypothetical protein